MSPSTPAPATPTRHHAQPPPVSPVKETPLMRPTLQSLVLTRDRPCSAGRTPASHLPLPQVPHVPPHTSPAFEPANTHGARPPRATPASARSSGNRPKGVSPPV